MSIFVWFILSTQYMHNILFLCNVRQPNSYSSWTSKENLNQWPRKMWCPCHTCSRIAIRLFHRLKMTLEAWVSQAPDKHIQGLHWDCPRLEKAVEAPIPQGWIKFVRKKCRSSCYRPLKLEITVVLFKFLFFSWNLSILGRTLIHPNEIAETMGHCPKRPREFWTLWWFNTGLRLP